jgi:ribosomal protein L37AE/L43A
MIVREDGKEIFSMGWAHYPCEFCGWITTKYYENHVEGIVKCDQCGKNTYLGVRQAIPC